MSARRERAPLRMQFFERAGYPTKSFRPRKLDVISDVLNFGALYAIFGCTGCVILPALLHRLDRSASFATLQRVPGGTEAALAVAAAAGTLAATAALLRAVPALRGGLEQDYEELYLTRPPLDAKDIAVLTLAPALSSELLLRGVVVGSLGLRPAPIVLAALLAAGALRLRSRSAATSAVEALQGVVWGGVLAATQSLWAAALAHALADGAALALWLRQQPRSWLALESSDDEGPAR